MLDRHVQLFVSATIFLEEAKFFLLGLKSDIAKDPRQDTPKNRRVIGIVIEHALKDLRQGCILSDMQEFLAEADHLESRADNFQKDQTFSLDAMVQTTVDIARRLQEVLKQEFYFHVDQRDVQFYVAEKPFGRKVAEMFDAANEDIAEAAKCVALQRPTACVFHLMRVLELGVQALGTRLKVKLKVQDETWHQIMLHVNKAVEALPSKTSAQKKKKSRFAEVAAHLQSVRLAWRNEVMHPKQTYTRDEALTIFNNCNAFMQHLAEII